jgi:release factor glutamine methyltransferase
MRVREALREGAAALARTETPLLDASLLLAAALGTDTARILASGPDEVGEAQLERYRLDLGRRSAGLPVAYLLGYKEFWGRRFAVDPRVLVPRPDTETLVDAALKLGDSILREREERRGRKATTETAENTENTENRAVEEGKEKEWGNDALLSIPSLRGLRGESTLRLRAHECCTGSGCVAVSLACERPDWIVSASDLSQDSLEVAAANSAELIASERPGGPIALSRRDILSRVGLEPGEGDPFGPFDLILANPPYIPSSEAEALLSRGWSEPRMALDGGRDGLDLVRRLVPEAARALAPGGWLLVEADGEQAGALAELFRASRLDAISAIRDLAGRARVTVGRKQWTP